MVIFGMRRVAMRRSGALVGYVHLVLLLAMIA